MNIASNIASQVLALMRGSIQNKAYFRLTMLAPRERKRKRKGKEKVASLVYDFGAVRWYLMWVSEEQRAGLKGLDGKEKNRIE